MLLLLLLFVSAVCQTEKVHYICSGNDRGVCRPFKTPYPIYQYNVYVDYFDDMALKVYANATRDFPTYTCEIYGWLTPRELTWECTSSRNNTLMPSLMYCSGSRDLAICVDE